MDDDITPDDLISPTVAASLEDDRIVTAAVVIVATAGLDRGQTLHLRVPDGVPSTQAIGMLKSCLNRLEADDLASWEGEE